MSSLAIGSLGVLTLLAVLFVRVPIGVALVLVGVGGYAAMDGWRKAFFMLGTVPFELASAYSLSVVPLFILMRVLGLVNTHGSLILTYLTFGLPLAIWLLKGFYDNIPIQLEQAARIDGATRFQAFILIVMPLSTPVRKSVEPLTPCERNDPTVTPNGVRSDWSKLKSN